MNQEDYLKKRGLIMEDKLEICSFCDKHKDEVAKLVAATKAAICNECIELCYDITRDDTKREDLLS